MRSAAALWFSTDSADRSIHQGCLFVAKGLDEGDEAISGSLLTSSSPKTIGRKPRNSGLLKSMEAGYCSIA